LSAYGLLIFFNTLDMGPTKDPIDLTKYFLTHLDASQNVLSRLCSDKISESEKTKISLYGKAIALSVSKIRGFSSDSIKIVSVGDVTFVQKTSEFVTTITKITFVPSNVDYREGRMTTIVNRFERSREITIRMQYIGNTWRIIGVNMS
jgi:hypothetical protein